MGRPVELQLVPKSLHNLAQTHHSWEHVAELVNPNPDWTLDILRHELNTLAPKPNPFFSTPTRLGDDHPTPEHPSSQFSWREISVPADFGRPSRPFAMRVFDDDDEDEDSESDDEFEEIKKTNVSDDESLVDEESDRKQVLLSDELGQMMKLGLDGCLFLPKTSVAEATLAETERARLLRVQEEFRHRKEVLESACYEERKRSENRISLVLKEEEAKCQMASRLDKQYQRSIAEARDEHLSAIQRSHEQRSQVEERKIRKEVATEEARKREEELARARAEAETRKIANQQLEAERAAAAAAAEREAKAAAAAAAAQQRAEGERKAQFEKELEAKKVEDAKQTKPSVIASEKALEMEAIRTEKLKALQGALEPILSNPVYKKDLKALERKITLIATQIALNEEQLRQKTSQIIQLMGSGTQYGIVTLASKLLSQCESQVIRFSSYAFALAQVVINVSVQIPDFMDIMLAKLNDVCILSVPKYINFSKDRMSNEAYYSALGFQTEGEGKLESTDTFLIRMKAHMHFYAAITQGEPYSGSNPHGISNGWQWFARFLNRLPANRITATALHAYLEIAGYRLFQVYPKPFLKILRNISEFLLKLKAKNDPDATAIINQLETYLGTEAYKKLPEGCRVPQADRSAILFQEALY